MAEREQYWRDLVQRWEVGEASVAEFCAWEGVSTSAFYQWRKRLAVSDGQSGPLFVPVRVTSAASGSVVSADDRPSGAVVVISLPEGIVVRVADGTSRQTIADVFCVLGTGR